MEAGLKEVGAALLAGLALGLILDFVYTNASTSGWFARPILNNPGTPASGGLPGGGGASVSISLPAPTTC